MRLHFPSSLVNRVRVRGRRRSHLSGVVSVPLVTFNLHFLFIKASKLLLCSCRNFLGTKETSLLLMAMFVLAVFYHGQQVRAEQPARPLTFDPRMFSEG